jgi:cellulose biosynthesis protein BcsQ
VKFRRKLPLTSAYDVGGALAQLGVLRPKLDDVPAPRVIAFAAGKGGVGKTSICANFASVLSAAGWRVLVVDLDTQSNQSVLFGVDPDDPGLDEGKGLLAAVLTGDTAHVSPLREVRPGVDLIPAGVETRKLSDYLATRSSQAERCDVVRTAIHRLADGHDLVVIDSRPSGELLGELALLAANYIVIPTRTDSMSWDRGLTTIADLYDAAEADARILGCAIFATTRGAAKIQAETRAQLRAKLGGVAPVFETMIYYSERAAKDQSETGLTADEYAAAARALSKPIWEDPTAPRFARNADGTADDYASLTVEIIEALLAGERV